MSDSIGLNNRSNIPYSDADWALLTKLIKELIAKSILPKIPCNDPQVENPSFPIKSIIPNGYIQRATTHEPIMHHGVNYGDRHETIFLIQLSDDYSPDNEKDTIDLKHLLGPHYQTHKENIKAYVFHLRITVKQSTIILTYGDLEIVNHIDFTLCLYDTYNDEEHEIRLTEIDMPVHIPSAIIPDLERYARNIIKLQSIK